MAMSSKRWGLAPVISVTLVAGCETVGENRSLDPGFGESARYNAALHTIDPDPRVGADAMMPGANAAVGAAAGRRYRTDSVKKIEKITTTTGGESPR